MKKMIIPLLLVLGLLTNCSKKSDSNTHPGPDTSGCGTYKTGSNCI